MYHLIVAQNEINHCTHQLVTYKKSVYYRYMYMYTTFMSVIYIYNDTVNKTVRG